MQQRNAIPFGSVAESQTKDQGTNRFRLMCSVDLAENEIWPEEKNATAININQCL